MPAPIGSKNAEKWTVESVKTMLDHIEQYVRDGQVRFLGNALMRLHLSRRAWSYWKKKFADDEDIMDQIDQIENIFETRLFEGALDGHVPAAVAIFGLKHNHHWSDRPHTEQPAQLPVAESLMTISMGGGRVITVP